MKLFRYIFSLTFIIGLTSFSTAWAGELHEAAKTNDTDRIRKLISQGAPINSKDETDRSALYCAAQGGHIPALKLLVDHGADVNAVSVDDDSMTPLIVAIYRGHYDVVKFLVEHGANTDAKDKDGLTATSWAMKQGELKIVQLLAMSAANINADFGRGTTFLHYAAAYGHVEFVTLLLSRGADVNARTKLGETPLHRAARKGYIKIATILLAHNADVNATGYYKVSRRTPWGVFMNDGITPLHYAVGNAHLGMVKLLVRNRAHLESKRSGSIYNGSGVNYLTPLRLAKLRIKYKPGLRTEYQRIADYLRGYLEVGGSLDMVERAIKEYAAELKIINRRAEAQQMEQNARAFGRTIGFAESVNLGFDPSALLEEYAGLLKERGQDDKAVAMEELATWYFHANMAAAVKAGEKYKKQQDDMFEEEED